jgi:hypothetical protein
MTPRLQEFIHRLEVGEGVRWVRAAACLLGLLAIVALYSLLEYRNLSHPAAMDAAQVARQLARGDGFTTQFIRPLSIQLLERQAERRGGETSDDPGRLRQPHPDLANPPLYPLFLAATFTLAPPSETIPVARAFSIYRPDRMIVWLNQLLVVVLVVLTYLLGLRLFDGLVGLLSALAVAGSVLHWRLAATGQATVLATVLVVTLTLCLSLLDQRAREGDLSGGAFTVRGGLIGLLAGLAGLTHYALLVLILPVLALLTPGLPGRRWSGFFAAVLAFFIVVGPWLARNHHLSGHWFGTASAVLVSNDPELAGELLERSLEVGTGLTQPGQSVRRAASNLITVLQDRLPGIGGSWVAAFFVVGLLFRFSSPGRNIMRVFVLAVAALMILVQAVAGDSGQSPEAVMGRPDYLAVVGPLILVFGAAFFSSLLEHVDWAIEGIRPLVLGMFTLLALAPIALVLLPPRPNPRTYPPYYPPMLQSITAWIEPQEILMSDVPWAVAWYGDRRAVWLPRFATEPGGREDFAAVHERRHPVAGLYLTQTTTDRRFFTDMLQTRVNRQTRNARARQEGSQVPPEDPAFRLPWAEFALECLAQQRAAPSIPLRDMHSEVYEYGQLLLMDRPRWPGRPLVSESSADPLASP